MSIGETPTAEKPTDDFSVNTRKLAELKAQFNPDMSDADLDVYKSERQRLTGANEEYGKAQEEANTDNEILDAHTEADIMNKNLDAAKATAAEATRLKAEAETRAEQAKQDQAVQEQALAEADALAKRIISGDLGSSQETSISVQATNVEGGTVESTTNQANTKEEVVKNEKPIEERLEAPKTPMFEKYGSRMRQAAAELVLVRKEMDAKDLELKSAEFKTPKWQKLWDEKEELNDKRNQLQKDASWGGKVIELRRQKSGESYRDYDKYQGDALKEYKQTAMQDPIVVMSLAESDNLGSGYREGEGIGQVSRELRGNVEFMTKVLSVLPRNRTGDFWAHCTGEVEKSRELYVAAIQKNHLNYQFGPKKWTTDPEIQKIALESGLDPMYLQK